MTNPRTFGLFTFVSVSRRSRKSDRRGEIWLRMACMVLTFCLATAMAAPTQTFTVLYDFNINNGSSVGNPVGSVVQGSDGNFYGVGTSYYGTVYKMTPEGTETTLYRFCSQPNCTDGEYLAAGVFLANDGNFYGTTEEGGTGLYGTVYKMTPEGTLTTLYNFCSQPNCTDGESPMAALIQASDGNLYGTTAFGGSNGWGTVFRVTSGGTLTTLYNFCSQPNCTDGSDPSTGLIQASDGNFYGTTAGTVFKITSGGTLTTLYRFCSQPKCTDGSGPKGALIQATDGSFYGTTNVGGVGSPDCQGLSQGCGTVFKITPQGALTTLYSFCAQANCADGVYPAAGLVQGSDGNFYGTTSYGGIGYDKSYPLTGNGTIFQITSGGTLTTVHSFTGTDGANPLGGLLQASNGTFYGTTSGGGEDYGTFFSLLMGVGGPAITLSPTALNFGDEIRGEPSAALTVTATNTGSATLDIDSITINGDFAIFANTCGATLAPGVICNVSVTFTPQALGLLTGTLTFTDNAPNSPQGVALSGTGVKVMPATLTPATAKYAKQKVGTTSKPKTFTLTNNQTVALTGIAISTTGDFAVSATTCTTSLAAKGK